MNVDDHAIDSLKVWFDIAIDSLIRETEEVKCYEKLSDLPSYASASAYAKAINVLVDACYLPEYRKQYRVSVKKRVDGF